MKRPGRRTGENARKESEAEKERRNIVRQARRHTFLSVDVHRLYIMASITSRKSMSALSVVGTRCNGNASTHACAHV